MPDDPNNPLAGYDLEAWTPPAPPAGMADTVVTRMTKQPPPAARAHVAVQKQSLRTVFAAAGATLVASAAVAVLVMTHHAAPAAQVVETGPVAPPAPLVALPAGRVALPAGSPEDDAHVAALEKRVLELEVAVERLRAELQLQEQQQQRSLPPLAPRPVVVAPREADAFDTQHGPSGDDGLLCNPFESAHGCHVDRPRPPPAEAPGPGASLPSPPCDPFSSRREGCGRDAGATGKVHVQTKPVTHIAIDSQDTQQSTPADFVLPAGKHKITVEVNGDKYTYPLTIRPGETTTFEKDLE